MRSSFLITPVGVAPHSMAMRPRCTEAGPPTPILNLACAYTVACLVCFTACLPCASCTDCSLITNNNTQTLHLTGAMTFEGCRWSLANVQLIADGPFALTLHDVKATGGTLLISLAFESDAGSSIAVENSALTGCTDCLSVESSKNISGVYIRVTGSTVIATRSAFSLRSPQSVQQSSIEVRSSRVEARCSDECSVASVQSAGVQDVYVAAVLSRLVAATEQGSLCAALSVMPFPSTSIIVASNVTLLATQCNISASGNNAVGSVAFVALSGAVTSITVEDVAVYAYQSTITTTGILCRIQRWCHLSQ